MSQIKIRAALETALSAISPALSTAWENVPFQAPAADMPYQQVFLLFAAPENPEAGNSIHIQKGIMQVSLRYPLLAGDGVARARAELIQTAFYRGRSMTNGGVVTVVESTPEIGQGISDEGRWFIPVKIRFVAQIT